VAVRFSKWGEGIIRRSIAAWGFLIAALLLVGSIEANAAPCQAHQGKAKAECIKQAKRDRMAWPPKPSEAEIRRRVGDYNWNKAHRVAVCETGKRLDWYPNGRFRGPLGMFSRTQDYGKRATGYWSPATWQEHVAIAVAAHPITGGWSGWGCGSA
jgi:hypothetical protein